MAEAATMQSRCRRMGIAFLLILVTIVFALLFLYAFFIFFVVESTNSSSSPTESKFMNRYISTVGIECKDQLIAESWLEYEEPRIKGTGDTSMKICIVSDGQISEVMLDDVVQDFSTSKRNNRFNYTIKLNKVPKVLSIKVR